MIPLIQPYLGVKEIDAVYKVFKSKHLTTGDRVKEFEELISNRTGMKHVICVNSATSGLHLLLEALRLSPKSKIAIPTNTFVATAHIVEQAGHIPVFCDTYDDENAYECDAVIPVSIGGDYPILRSKMQSLNIPFIEDCAHLFPDRPEATYGGVYSFHANKMITTGEGGAIVTNSDEIEEYVRSRGYFGIVENNNGYDILGHGYKYNMSDIQAAMGIEQIKKLDEILEKRITIRDYYNDNLDQDYMDLPNSVIPYLYQVKLRREKLSMPRRLIKEILWNNYTIETGIHFEPLHMKSYYKVKYGLFNSMFPEATDIYNRTLSIPIYPGLSKNDMEYVCNTINKICKELKR
jgi:dTDP-4-amino-4,6-dideoxygalactose transaminase